MSLPYFFTDDPAAGTLTGAEAKHAHVKRIAPGEHIMLIDGQGSTALTRVTSVEAGRVDGVVEKQEFVPQPTPRVTVVQAVPKGERAELAVDLAVQAGADAIVPWISHRTIARWPANKQAKQVEKWRAPALSSAPTSTCRQSHVLPRLNRPLLHEDAYWIRQCRFPNP